LPLFACINVGEISVVHAMYWCIAVS